MYTSLELSKKLQENGCNLGSEYWYKKINYVGFSSIEIFKKNDKLGYSIVPAYDIIYDICIKYGKEFFGDGKIISPQVEHYLLSKLVIPYKILEMLQQKRPQKEVEEYLWENCLFNPKNKKGK